jgi:tetratricopeptide (TPR) repeat protein
MALKPPPLPSAARRGPGASDLALKNAAAALQAGRPLEAERLAAGVLKGNSGSVPAMQILGSALSMLGRNEEAVAPLERAARASRDAATETQLATALRKLGRLDDARERLERAIKRKPPFAPAFVELADTLSALDRQQDAIDIVQQGLAIAPNFAELSARLGRLLALQGKTKQAREAFGRTLALAPGHADALFSLARIFQAERDFTQAADVYRRMLAARPNDPEIRIGLGICLMELGRTEEALGHLRAAGAAGAKTYGEVVSALADAGKGRFWLRPSDAARALRGGKS